jgi:nucleosome-remodeling factor subunit BPTF
MKCVSIFVLEIIIIIEMLKYIECSRFLCCKPQKDLSTELAARTKAERNKQDEVRTGSGKRKSAPVSATANSPPSTSRSGGRPRKQQRTTPGPPSSGGTTPGGGGGGGGGRRREKLYCLCRTPYDETK